MPPTTIQVVVNPADNGRLFTVMSNGVSTSYTASPITIDGVSRIGFSATVPMHMQFSVSAANSSAVVQTGTGIGIAAFLDVSQSFLPPPLDPDPGAQPDLDGSVIGLKVFAPPLH